MALKYNALYHGDCLKVMQSIKSSSIDMILCDLPYGMTNNQHDKEINIDMLWRQYKQVIKSNGLVVLSSIQPFTTKLIMSNLTWFRYDIIWVKDRNTGFLNANRMPLRQHENMLVFYNKLPTYNPQKIEGMPPVHKFTKHCTDGVNYGKTKLISGGGSTKRYPSSVIFFPAVGTSGSSRLAPTQKPVALFEYLIKTYTNKGDIVLDNCAGSGTTGEACLNLGRRFILIEKEIKYCKVICKRLNVGINKLASHKRKRGNVNG